MLINSPLYKNTIKATYIQENYKNLLLFLNPLSKNIKAIRIAIY